MALDIVLVGQLATARRPARECVAAGAGHPRDRGRAMALGIVVGRVLAGRSSPGHGVVDVVAPGRTFVREPPDLVHDRPSIR
jgi:hypothetical protein